MFTRNYLKLTRNNCQKLLKRHLTLHEDSYTNSQGRKIKVLYSKGPSYVYRNQSKQINFGTNYNIATIVATIQWYVCFHGIWHYPHFLFGEYFRPDATKWTDEQLGIPPDDYDEELE